MAATYLQRYSFISDNEKFITRVKMAAVDVAIDVNAEPASGDPALDAQRSYYAADVLRTPDNHARLLAHGVVVHDNAKSDMTDADLYTIIADIWNAYAGVKAA